MQNKGLGRLLALTLAEAARERGIRTFRAEVLASNLPMRQMLEDLGAHVHRESTDSIVIDVSLDDPPAVIRWIQAAADRLAGRFRSSVPPRADSGMGAGTDAGNGERHSS